MTAVARLNPRKPLPVHPGRLVLFLATLAAAARPSTAADVPDPTGPAGVAIAWRCWVVDLPDPANLVGSLSRQRAGTSNAGNAAACDVGVDGDVITRGQSPDDGGSVAAGPEESPSFLQQLPFASAPPQPWEETPEALRPSLRHHKQGTIRGYFGAGLNEIETVRGDSSGVASTPTFCNVGIGYFGVDNLEIGFEVSMSQYRSYEESSSGSVMAADFMVLYKYYFTNPTRLVPYIGIKAGYLTVDEGGGSGGVIAGGTAGIEIMQRDGRYGFFCEFNYKKSMTDSDWERYQKQVILGIAFLRPLRSNPPAAK